MAVRCTMPTASLRPCSRPARYAYWRGEGTSESPVREIATYCAQHYRAGGHSRILRPRAWEYDRIIDLASHVEVTR